MTTPNITIEVGEEMVAGFAKKGLGQVRPSSSRDRGDGPFRRLVLRGATVIDGTGAPPWGPADIVLEGDRITEIAAVGVPGLPINDQRRPAAGDHEIDCTGKFVTPELRFTDDRRGADYRLFQIVVCLPERCAVHSMGVTDKKEEKPLQIDALSA